MEESAVPVVLVVGAECAARERVARALAAELGAEARGGAGAGASAAHTWWRVCVRTRYYEAEVELVALAEPAEAPAALRRAQAAIAVAGAADEVVALLAALGPALDSDAIESRAVVIADRLLAEGGDGDDDADGPLLEYGFEKVHDVARLKELLEVTMWRGMKLINGAGARAVTACTRPLAHAHSQQAPAAAVCATGSSVAVATDGGGGGGGDDDDDVSAAFGDWSSWKSGQDDSIGMADADGFGALIDQVRAMRSMPEAIRKEQAAAMALRLAAMLGVDGEDSDDQADVDEDNDSHVLAAAAVGAGA
jgi:hypothetical protein